MVFGKLHQSASCTFYFVRNVFFFYNYLRCYYNMTKDKILESKKDEIDNY